MFALLLMTSTCQFKYRYFLHSSKLNNLLQFGYKVFSEGLFKQILSVFYFEGGGWGGLENSEAWMAGK